MVDLLQNTNLLNHVSVFLKRINTHFNHISSACHGIIFDQPLLYKANQIITSEALESDVKKTVVRLGGFHTEMSFMGDIGYIMSDSGLHEILSVIYAEKAVSHMLSGKAINFQGT